MRSDLLNALTDRAGGTLIETLGIQLTAVEGGRASGEMEFRPELQQLTGLFHAGAILSLADTVATSAAISALSTDGDLDLTRFPLAIQISVNLIGNARDGKLLAEALTIHSGRSTIVVETRVTDSLGKSVVVTTTTLLVPRS